MISKKKEINYLKLLYIEEEYSSVELAATNLEKNTLLATIIYI